MTTDEMNQDLKRFTDFEQVSNQVSYWRRRLALSADREAMTEEFDRVVHEHSMRALSVLRAG